MAAVCAACGQAPAPVPKGPPAARHGERALDDLTAVEHSRAQLVASWNLYALGFAPDARDHLAAARARYHRRLARRVRGRDRRLEHEIAAAFRAVDAAMGALAPFEAVSTRLSPLTDQLLGGAAAALVPRAARSDPGVQAVVLSQMARSLSEAYADGVSTALPPRRARLQEQRAYGLLVRCQGLARTLGPTLGPQWGPVVETLSRLRGRAYPVGIQRPRFAARPDEVAMMVARVRRALDARYGLSYRSLDPRAGARDRSSASARARRHAVSRAGPRA